MPRFETPLKEFCKHMTESYRELSGSPLLPETPDGDIEDLYNADNIIVAHRTASDPVFCFANLKAQQLWEMEWDEFTSTPSRLSAPENARAERQSLLDTASERNIITDYTGVRISKTGRLFHIKNVTLWNIFDTDKTLIGQAASFSPALIEFLK